LSGEDPKEERARRNGQESVARGAADRPEKRNERATSTALANKPSIKYSICREPSMEKRLEFPLLTQFPQSAVNL